MYIPGKYEVRISDLLREKGIKTINDLNIETLARAFNLDIRFVTGSSCMLRFQGVSLVLINKNLNDIERYEDFLHELSHFIIDSPSLLKLAEKDYYYMENRVDYVMQFIAIPLFTLEKVLTLGTVECVSQCFNISHKLARIRLGGIKNKLIGVV